LIENFNLNFIFNSPLKKKLIKNIHNNFKFISFYGNFYLTTDFYLPICAENFCTSTDLFGFYVKEKYSELLNVNLEKKVSRDKDNIEVIEDAFICGSTGNYYHDLIDCYSRLFSFDKNFLFHKNIRKIVISNSHIKGVLEHFLERLSIECPILVLKKNNLYKFKNSIIVANRKFDRTIKLYKKFYSKKYVTPQKNIFISRKDSKMRIIENEDEVYDYLKKYNFENITLTGKSFEEQIDLFSSSKIIISMHGAALTNLLFAQPGSKVIELSANYIKNSEDWYTEKNSKKFNHFTRHNFNVMAEICDIDHYFYFSRVNKITGDKNLKFDFQELTYANQIVDMKVFKNLCNQVLR